LLFVGIGLFLLCNGMIIIITELPNIGQWLVFIFLGGMAVLIGSNIAATRRSSVYFDKTKGTLTIKRYCWGREEVITRPLTDIKEFRRVFVDGPELQYWTLRIITNDDEIRLTELNGDGDLIDELAEIEKFLSIPKNGNG
jgi:hypothetical protein